MTNAPCRTGLIAGWGRYPIVIAEALKRQGHYVCCLGVKDHADPVLAEVCDEYHLIGLAQIGKATGLFRRRQISQATMAGKIHKVKLFEPFMWFKHLPDWYGVKTFFPHFGSRSKDSKDDSLMGAIVEAFARRGIDFSPATDFLPELLVKYGQLTSGSLSNSQRKDVEFGWNLAKEMGRLDVGQSVAVKRQAVLAVEAIEGTDEAIRRAGSLCTSGGFTIVKVAKPQQDMRFDVPTIGIQTLKTMVETGARVLAIEAGMTIVIDQQEVIQFANDHRLTIVALSDAQSGQVTDAA